MTKHVSRRSFIEGALLWSASAAFAARTPEAHFPTDPRARLAVASYPFREFIVAPKNSDRDPKQPGMDLVQFARMIPKEFGVPGIEPLSTHFPSTDLGVVRKLRKEFDAAGVHTVNIPVDDAVDLCSEDAGKRAEGNERYRRWVNIAVVLGSPGIRVWIPKCAQRSDLSRAWQALMPTVTYAASRNIVVALENDDPVNASAARTIAFLKLANNPFLRGLPDFGNGLQAGDEQFTYQNVKDMFPFAWSIAHVKDAEVIKGQRKTVSLDKLFPIAKAAGYRGYFSMESESGGDPRVDTKRLIAESLRLLS
jgi:sugar phosphate isomerase/epimerase